ncbi:MAG TPA: T9SS type A sorting domain-containing protein [Candidatus Marinimicrobia bacterium]|nr:T9SS type A sorting domain-containing protein [Candidatus Neomarinimicrobiota bacterium]
MKKLIGLTLLASLLFGAGLVEGSLKHFGNVTLTGLAPANGVQAVPASKAKGGDYALACQTEDFSYLPNMDNYIYGPPVQLPNGRRVTADFFIRGYFDDFDTFPDVDYWGCEVSPDGGDTWYPVSNPYGDPDGNNFVYIDVPEDWSSFNASYSIPISLDNYAGQTIQLRWYFHSDEDAPIGEGFFLDDISVTVDGNQVFFEDFEDQDTSGWYSEDATAIPAQWHVTETGAYDGTSWAMNDPSIGQSGGYLDAWYQVLDSPPVRIPASGTNTISFMHNFKVEDPAGATAPYTGWDGMNVRISNDGGESWTVLTDVTPAYNVSSLYSFGYEHGEGPNVPGWGGSSDGWVPVTFTLPEVYNGQELIIRWAFASDPGYNSTNDPTLFGWIIDNIDIAGVLTNSGTAEEGWLAQNLVPIGGDLWHLKYVAELPMPYGLTAEAGDGEVALSWESPVTGSDTLLQYDDSGWRIYVNDMQAYAVIFDVTEDNSILKEAKVFLYGESGFSGTFDVSVYAVDAEMNIGEILYTIEDLTPNASGFQSSVKLLDSQLRFDAGDKFALAVSGFATSNQGILLEKDTVTTPADGRSFCGGPSWTPIGEAYTGAGDLGIRAELIQQGDGLAPVHFNLYRRLSTQSYSAPYVSEITGTSYRDTEVSNGVSYYYTVTAFYNEYGESQKAQEVMGKPESQTVFVVSYDDSTAETGFNLGQDGQSAVRFSLPEYPAALKKVRFWSNGNAMALVKFYIWADDNGQPGDYLTLAVVNAQPGWNERDFSSANIVLESGDIWIGFIEMSATQPIGLDTDSDQGRSYWYDPALESWDLLSNVGFIGNIMIHAYFDSNVISSASDSPILPGEITLLPNFPNPFNPVTQIRFALPSAGNAELVVYNLRGETVGTLINGWMPAGWHNVSFEGSALPSGIYIYRLKSESAGASGKMILLK